MTLRESRSRAPVYVQGVRIPGASTATTARARARRGVNDAPAAAPVDGEGAGPPPSNPEPRTTNERALPPGKAGKQGTRIVAYARVSTDKQASEGVSLEAQTAKFAAYAVAHDVELVGVQSDALSGKNTSRAGLQRALAMLERGEADGLLVAKLDRLTRSVRDMGDLLETYFDDRYKLFSVADCIDTRSAGGRFMLNVITSVAQWERETIGERTRDGLAHVRAMGGGTPRLEGEAVERIVELEAEGLSLGAIARRLTEEGVETLKGGKWAKETVRKVLARVHGAQK